VRRKCPERKHRKHREQRREVKCGAVHRRLVGHPYPRVAESEYDEEKEKAAGDDRRERGKRRCKESLPRQYRGHERAIPEKIPVSIQEVAFGERSPCEIKVEVKPIIEESRLRLHEQPKQQQAGGEADPDDLRAMFETERNDCTRNERQRPRDPGVLDLGARKRHEERQSEISRVACHGPAQQG